MSRYTARIEGSTGVRVQDSAGQTKLYVTTTSPGIPREANGHVMTAATVVGQHVAVELSNGRTMLVDLDSGRGTFG